jgi:hypothetical protein
MWLLVVAVAVAGDVGSEPVDETIVVEDSRAEAVALENLERAIRENGYFQFTIRGVRRFVPLRVWRPNVTIRESGDIRIGARTFTLMHFATGPAALDGVQGGPRTARTQESQLRAELQPWIDQWNAARLTRGQHQRENEVRVSLERLWSEGVGFHREPLATWEARRCAISQFHDTRTETSEGRAVQSIVAGFVATVVQHSPEPYAVGSGCPQPG